MRVIGADAMARIVEDAVAAANYDPAIPHDARQSAMTELDEDSLDRLDELDQAFYAYPNDLVALLYEYVSKQEAAFAHPD